MRQWIAIGAAVGLVAVSLPYLRSHDAQLAEMLAKGKAHAGAAVVTRQVAPPPLTNLDLTRSTIAAGSPPRRPTASARRS